MAENRDGWRFVRSMEDPRKSRFGTNDANRAGEAANTDNVPELEINVN